MRALLIATLLISLPIISAAVDVDEQKEKLTELEELCKKYGKKPKQYLEISHPIKVEKVSDRIVRDKEQAEETPIRRMQIISNDNIDTYCE